MPGVMKLGGVTGWLPRPGCKRYRVAWNRKQWRDLRFEPCAE